MFWSGSFPNPNSWCNCAQTLPVSRHSIGHVTYQDLFFHLYNKMAASGCVTSLKNNPCKPAPICLFKQARCVKGFDPNTSTQLPGDPQLLLRHCQGSNFPLACDSEAVYSSKALWRSRLAVIIQLMGYEWEQARHTSPGSTDQRDQEPGGAFGLSDWQEVSPPREELQFHQESFHVTFEDSFGLISNTRLIPLLAWLTHMLISVFSC